MRKQWAETIDFALTYQDENRRLTWHLKRLGHEGLLKDDALLKEWMKEDFKFLILHKKDGNYDFVGGFSDQKLAEDFIERLPDEGFIVAEPKDKFFDRFIKENFGETNAG